MLRRTMVLGAALAVMAVLVVPGVASGNWGHNGEVIQENYTLGELNLTGNTRFQGMLGGIECQVIANALLEPGTTGTLRRFEPHPIGSTNNCKGLGGLAFCQIHGVESTGLPWSIHTASETTMTITRGEIHTMTTGGFCPVKTVVATPATITGTVNNAKAIGSMQEKGTVQTDLQTNAGTVDQETTTVSGTLSVVAPSSGTYEM